MAGIENEFFHDIMLFTLILTFTFTIFAAFIGSALPVNNPTLQKLNATIKGINGAGLALSYDLNKTWVNDTALWGTGFVLNYGLKFVHAIIDIVLLIVIIIISLILIIWVILPALFAQSSFGVFGAIFQLIMLAALTVFSFGFVYYLAVMFGWRKHTGKQEG